MYSVFVLGETCSNNSVGFQFFLEHLSPSLLDNCLQTGILLIHLRHQHVHDRAAVGNAPVVKVRSIKNTMLYM